jgi:23S rRNA (cytidine1920-2'-O)/16S rRNA (cytidine1409-2'-O)-methyltransferase
MMVAIRAARRVRADELMLSRGLAHDMHEAQALIMAHKVRAGDDAEIVVDKPGIKLLETTQLTVRHSRKYVGRGGYKLNGALRDFDIDVSEMKCVDLGASTGGFTDCLLRHGASSVCAVDVGYGQLAYSLATDSRVEVRDRINIRTADADKLGAPFDVVVADLSFVGIAMVAKDIARFAGEKGQCVLLIKPQFEAKRDEVGAGGIVSDKAVHSRVLNRVIEALDCAGLNTSALTVSPLRGGVGGNIEFWLYCGKTHTRIPDVTKTIQSVVTKAHENS